MKHFNYLVKNIYLIFHNLLWIYNKIVKEDKFLIRIMWRLIFTKSYRKNKIEKDKI
jgi:hypothetical protein